MTYYDPYREENQVAFTDTAVALIVELHRLLSTMPDPTYEMKCALADVQRFFTKHGRRHQL